MIAIKTPKEIDTMSIGGKILADVLFKVLDAAKPGITEQALDEMADRLICAQGGEPGFKKVAGYKHATCISLNDVVVHGVPTARKLVAGDVLGIDCGVYYKGFHTDMSHTIRVRAQNSKRKDQNLDEVDKFLETGERALEEAIKQAKQGNRIGHISQTIQKIVEGGGYSVVRSLIGHGVGRELHEDPEVPGYLVGKLEKTPRLLVGMTIAIEVIYNMGKKDVVYANDDGWTIKTADGSMSGLFERTVAITGGPVVLTT